MVLTVINRDIGPTMTNRKLNLSNDFGKLKLSKDLDLRVSPPWGWGGVSRN